jgi:DNA (cytosine-5)-methyltransferase 1
MAGPFTVVDLFAGAGGFSLGFELAGFHSTAAFELDAWACETLRQNFPHATVVEGDISTTSQHDVKSLAKPNVLIGGPPCQGFSVAGSTQFGVDDPRNALFFAFLTFAELIKPDICVIENVPQLATKRFQGTTIPGIVASRLAPLGYSTRVIDLNAADFGVPQHRRRVFIISHLKHFDWVPPVQTHSASHICEAGLFTNETSPLITVGDAISDLPLVSAGEGTDECVPYATEPQNAYQTAMRTGSPGVRNHIAMKHTERLIARFQTIGHGKSLKDVSVEHGQKRYFTGEIAENPYKYNNYRLDPAKPSLAIPASFQSSFIHPQLNRNLTAREAARLMSFPDSFVFKGKRTTMSWEKHLSQYNQIGNAVCPLVAKAVAESCLAALINADVRPGLRNRVVVAVAAQHPSSAQSKGPLDRPETLLDSSVEQELNELGTNWVKKANMSLDDGAIFVDGFRIAPSLLPLAVLLITSDECPLCDCTRSPHGTHLGHMPFLISKDGSDSLLVKHKDNGLDFHLRRLTGIEHQCAHFVGGILEKMGRGRVLKMLNPRTGRKVLGIELTNCQNDVNSIRDAFRRDVERISRLVNSPSRFVASTASSEVAASNSV